MADRNTVFDYARPSGPGPRPRGFAATIAGGIAVGCILFAVSTFRIHFLQPFWVIAAVLVAFLSLPLLFASTTLTIRQCTRARTKPDLLPLAWLLVFLQCCFWISVAFWIKSGALSGG